jgi:RNA polymerase sigma-70 factor (ECF subfamily)
MNAPAREFELAVRSFSSDLYRFAYWLARDRYIAEELVQECFQRAWSNWASLNDPVALKKWLFTILRREFLRRFERKQFDLVDIEEVESPAADDLALDEVYGLRQALARAPESLRDVLLMQVLGGFSAEEIAELQQTSPGAITTRLSRARQWLRSALQGTETRLNRLSILGENP